MFNRALIGIGWILVLSFALWLRIDGLSERPIHFDEATGAHIFAERLENADYEFDPTHYHGPFQSLITLPIAKFFGQARWQELTLPMLRTGPVIAGMLMILTPLLWLRWIGAPAALAAAALLASSPLLVYYNRMYIHESWLALFGMLAAAAIYALIERPSRKWSILAGLAVGLMFATKETFVISLFCWALAGLACWFLLRFTNSTTDRTPPLSAYASPAVVFTAALLFCGALFYTEGFRRPTGMIDAFRTFFVYETTPGHEKEFGYYLHTLLWPKHTLGTWWTEGAVALLGFAACALAIRRKLSLGLITFIALGSVIHILVYSLIAYKTPWLMTLPWALACLLAGCLFASCAEKRPLGWSGALWALLALCLFFQTHQSVRASGRLSNHDANPYAYVPTSRNITQVPAWLHAVDQNLSKTSIQPIAVIGQSFWPLPWYLRDFDQVGYWPSLPKGIETFPVIFSMPEHIDASNRLLGETHTQLLRTLRSNVPVSLYLKNEIWAEWTKPTVRP